MKTIFIFFIGLCTSFGALAQSDKSITVSQSLTPYLLEVSFYKTVHIVFPAAVKYVDLGSTDIIAGKAENVMRVKAAIERFVTETNFSVITSDGSFYSFNVVYSDEPSVLNINIGQ